MDEEGLLTFVDRMKDIIISGRLDVPAAEAERCVSEYPGVLEVVVIAGKDVKFAHGGRPCHQRNRCCRTDRAPQPALADYKVPRYVAVEADPPALPRHRQAVPARPASALCRRAGAVGESAPSRLP
jgi:fatty-acyl-CoA synthase